MDDIQVPLYLLDNVLSTLNTTLSLSQTLDLQESYRKRAAGPKWSNLTKSLDRQVKELENIIEEGTKTEEDNNAEG